MASADERAPDAIEPITAYRVWLAAPDGSLSSLSGGTIWPTDRWLEARCPGGRHEAPRERCSCGVYAGKELCDVLSMALPAADLAAGIGVELSDLLPDEAPLPIRIVGRVHLAGKIVEHAFGYRAERARIAEILPLPGYDWRTEAVARLYAVPLGDTVSQDAIQRGAQRAMEEWRRIRVTFHSHPRPIHEEPSASQSALVLACSVFFIVNAIRGILMKHGPHWSEWWLWLIALGAVAVAAHSLIVVWPFVAGFRIWEARGSDGPAGGGPPPTPSHPRPY
jgi:hypothetical protein